MSYLNRNKQKTCKHKHWISNNQQISNPKTSKLLRNGTTLRGDSRWGPQGLRSKDWSILEPYHGGGWKDQDWCIGAHWGGWKPPPKGGVWDWSAGAGGLPPLQLGLEGCGAHHKIHKNIEIVGT